MNKNEIVATLGRALEAHQALTGLAFTEAFAQSLRELVAPLSADARVQALKAISQWADDKPTLAGLWAAVNLVFFESGLPQEFPTFLDGDAEDASPPFTHVRTASARELFGVQDGESLASAAQRDIDGGRQ